MTHEKHGVHIAYDEAEIERNKLNGWVVYGDTPPGVKVKEAAKEADHAPAVVTKRKYTRKAT